MAIVAMLTDRAQEQRMHLCMFFVLISLVPRPWRRKGLVHIARACAGVSIATDRVTIVIVCGFCMTYSSTGDKRRVYDSIRLPHIFLGSPGACACNVYQALSPPPLEGPGNEAKCIHLPMLWPTLRLLPYKCFVQWLKGALDAIFRLRTRFYCGRRGALESISDLRRNFRLLTRFSDFGRDFQTSDLGRDFLTSDSIFFIPTTCRIFPIGGRGSVQVPGESIHER